MNKISLERKIAATPSQVYAVMLHPEHYKTWTAAFNPTSYYEGVLVKGQKIKFLGTNPENGEKGGMLAEITEVIPGKQISFRHIGLVKGTEEITEGDEVVGWAGAMEEYFFNETEDGQTLLRIETDSNEEHKDYFTETWPKALDILVDLVAKEK